MHRKILVIAPHIDDEVLGAGGSIIKHVESGDEVHIVAITDREHLRDVQRAQAEEVREVIGAETYSFLGLRDMYLDVCMRDIIEPLESLYSDIKPDWVYGPFDGDINTDHQSVYRASTVVCRSLQAHKLEKFLLYEIPSSTEQGLKAFKPSVYNPINVKQMNKKISALNVYVEELRPFPHPRCSAGVVNYAVQRGMECGHNYAEAFINAREVLK